MEQMVRVVTRQVQSTLQWLISDNSVIAWGLTVQSALWSCSISFGSVSATQGGPDDLPRSLSIFTVLGQVGTVSRSMIETGFVAYQVK